ncbi:GntR family transcriptional regulator [Anaerosphaera multitolerans]|uniref:GntR family transcriptional regulator n=1 Tax=Anaerosphaera multitolerans TaxID=2487351 RepID=A0A437S4U9_9FIRM|nr:GntR family transcriptional regulator [Anaerosphaera multitolerans]RVU54055.1 GntR family transcriptional regulator [Anaerosphaera multitolerans]
MEVKDDRPIYIQVAEIIENQILNDSLLPNERAPSTNEFSNILEINPATARKGITILVEEGILYKKRGMGMYVTDDAKKIIIEKRKKEFYRETLPEILKEAKRLEISEEDLIDYIRGGRND